MNRVFALTLLIVPILFIFLLNNSYSENQKDLDELLSSPDAVIFYVNPGEPGLKSEGTFAVGGKNYFINRDEKLMGDLKALVDEAINDESKKIGVYVALNLDSFAGELPEENAALITFIQKFLSEAGCSQKPDSPYFCRTEDIVLFLESHDGLNPKPFIAFQVYSQSPQTKKMGKIYNPETTNDDPDRVGSLGFDRVVQSAVEFTKTYSYIPAVYQCFYNNSASPVGGMADATGDSLISLRHDQQRSCLKKWGGGSEFVPPMFKFIVDSSKDVWDISIYVDIRFKDCPAADTAKDFIRRISPSYKDFKCLFLAFVPVAQLKAIDSLSGVESINAIPLDVKPVVPAEKFTRDTSRQQE